MTLPILLVTSWSMAAFAGDTAAGPVHTASSAQAIAERARAVQAVAGGTILLAAAGPEAERAALDAARALPAGAVRVQRVGILGHDEVSRALAATGLACGLRVDATASGAWTLMPVGACSAPTPIAAPPATEPAAPDAEALRGIPGVGAALGALAAPPSAAPPLAPLTPPPPPGPDALTATYDAVALRRVDNPKPRPDLPSATWAVRDGRGHTLDAVEFARRTGDLATQQRIRRQGSAARSLGLGLAIGGGALLVSGLGVLAARDAGAPRWSEFEPQPSAFDSSTEYFDALAQAEADYRAAGDQHDLIREDRVWIAGVLGGAGVLALGAAPFAAAGATDRRALPALWWDAPTADALILAHNDSVRQRIGLAPAAPTRAVVVPAPAVPDEPEEPEEPEDPPEDRLEAPREAAPGPSTPALPTGPSGSREIQLTPVLGYGWAGLVGTF